MNVKTAINFLSSKCHADALRRLTKSIPELPVRLAAKSVAFVKAAHKAKGVESLVKVGKVSASGGILLGDNAFLHNRISGKNDFDDVVAGLSSQFARREVIEIGLSRYNFFKIRQVFKFCLEHCGSSAARMRSLNEAFRMFPLENIASELGLVVKTLNNIDPGIQVRIYDNHLLEILETLEINIGLYPTRREDLTRLLGIICEEAFIGPHVIVVDPFHRCNIRCAHCFVHNPRIHHQDEFLDRKLTLDKFREIISDAAELKTDAVILQGDGEPLMHPDFLKMLECVREKGLKALFFTNGSLLTRAFAEKILELEVAEIYCSLPAGTSSTYNAVCLKGQDSRLFETTVENMKTLMDLKKQGRRKFPHLIMTHVIHSMNYHELVKMAETDAHIGTDASRFYMIRIDDNNKHLRLSDAQLDVMKKDLPRAEEVFRKAGIEFISNIKFQLEHYDKETGAWSKDIFLKQGCTIGWHFALIPALGDLSMCCHLRTMGHLSKARFKDIWYSDYYRQKRIQAKFMSENTDVACMNGVKLYDEHCDHCDNHQNLLNTAKELKEFGLAKFFK